MDFEEDIKDKTTQPDLVKKYALNLLRRWPYILLFFIFCMGVGYAVNRYSTPVYLVKAKIITRKFSNKPETLIPGMVDPSIFLSGYSEVYEEIPLLKSPRRIAASIDKVDFRVNYFVKGWIKDSESLRGYGFEVVVDSISPESNLYGFPVFVNYMDGQHFQLKSDNSSWNKFIEGKKFRFGETIQLGDAILRLNNRSGILEADKYYFILNSRTQLINEYTNRLTISWVQRGSAMLDLHITSELPDREVQFLKAYYQVVEEFGLLEKNENLNNTIRFIDQQMKIISDSLLYYQALIDEHKFKNAELGNSNFNVSTGGSGSDFVLARLTEFTNKKLEIQLREQYFKYLIGYFKENRDEEIFAPSLFGLDIPLAQGWVNQYISAKLSDQRNTENKQNPLLMRKDSLQIRVERSIYEAIASERQRDSLDLIKLRNETDLLLGNVLDVQADYRQIAQYQRIYQLNQRIYDMFIQRRTEASISKASTTSDYEMMESPSYSRAPIKPDRNTNLMIAAAVGLMLPIGLFLLIDITNKRIMDMGDLQAHTQMPIVGNIAHSSYESRLVMKEHPRSVIAESFRAVRANLKFLATNVKSRSRTFLITSSVGGEGKTFFSLNLSYTLAQAHKDTIVIGADLRKPELGNYLEQKPEKGLSTYLAGYATIEEVIQNIDGIGPDFIDAGKLPPNPSELLANERMKKIMDYLKEKYEYIIIDTPPIGLVSDAMELFKYSDYNFLIVRQGVTEKTALDMVNQLYLEGKLMNCSVVFNDIQLQYKRKSIYGGYVYGLGYGGYGYGYYEGDNDKNNKG